MKIKRKIKKIRKISRRISIRQKQAARRNLEKARRARILHNKRTRIKAHDTLGYYGRKGINAVANKLTAGQATRLSSYATGKHRSRRNKWTRRIIGKKRK